MVFHVAHIFCPSVVSVDIEPPAESALYLRLEGVVGGESAIFHIKDVIELWVWPSVLVEGYRTCQGLVDIALDRLLY